MCKRLHSKLVLKEIGIKKDENTVPWTYVSNDLNEEKIVETFYEKKELQKTNQKQLRIEVIKRKGVKLYVKWK